jgi:uncharacterized protein (TIGR02246 family)
MCPQFSGSPYAASTEEAQIEKLYRDMIEGWNQRDAQKMVASFDDEAVIIGYDGSHHQGAHAMEEAMSQIFHDHLTPPYLAKVKRIRFLTRDVAQLEAIVGMIPPGKEELDPRLNAWQVITAIRKGRLWRIVHFQNTPAQFHGRPQAVEAMSRELLE